MLTYLSAALPKGIELIDFYHACEHLKAAFDTAYGENGSRSKAQFEKYRHILRNEAEGIEKIIRAVAHLRDTHPGKKKLATERAYFRSRRHRMRYAEAQAQNLPIGSGVVEAACKTLATDEALWNALASYRGAGHLDATCPASKRALRACLETVSGYL